jgi:hypothetical protein
VSTLSPVPARWRFGELWWILATALSLAVTAWIVYVGEGIDAYHRSRLVDMVHGTAYRPYVYRVLVPGVARLGASLWPGHSEAAHAADYVLVVGVMAASLVGFAFAVRALSRTVFSASPAVHGSIALIAVACLPLTFGPFSRQIYDFSTLCLFTWCLVLMARQQWAAFAAVFILACLNKESSILLPLVFLFVTLRAENRLTNANIAALFIYQIVVFALVRTAVVYAFGDNPGDTVEMHLYDHNQYVLLHPGEMSKRLILLLAVAIAGTWRWQQKPLFLRRAFLALAPALVVMGVTVGMVDEIRAYYEIYPVILLMTAHALRAVA